MLVQLKFEVFKFANLDEKINYQVTNKNAIKLVCKIFK